jgi:hypothetical protein
VDVALEIENQYQAYCNNSDSLAHCDAVVEGQDVVLDFERMVQYTAVVPPAPPSSSSSFMFNMAPHAMAYTHVSSGRDHHPHHQNHLHTSCRIKRLVVPADQRQKLMNHECMEVEYMGFYGLLGKVERTHTRT